VRMTSWMVAGAFASSLAACDRSPAETPAGASPPATSAAPAASGGISGVKPAAEGHAASSTGPSDGSAAIGGLAGGKGTGAHPAPPQGDTPAATGGDGSASAASK